MNRKVTLQILFISCAVSLAACNSTAQKSDGTTQDALAAGIAGKEVKIPQAIQDFIVKKYPNATIRKCEQEKNRFEVDILDKDKPKEVYFDSSNQWLSTEWEIRSEEVPAAVMAELTNSAYENYDVKEIDAIEKPAGMFYAFELKQFNDEVNLMFDSLGQLIK